MFLYLLWCCELTFFSQPTYGHLIQTFVFSVDDLVWTEEKAGLERRQQPTWRTPRALGVNAHCILDLMHVSAPQSLTWAPTMGAPSSPLLLLACSRLFLQDAHPDFRAALLPTFAPSHVFPQPCSTKNFITLEVLGTQLKVNVWRQTFILPYNCLRTDLLVTQLELIPWPLLSR